MILPRTALHKVPPRERIFHYSIPEPNSGCWLWLGADDGCKGYGRITYQDKMHSAHKFSWEHFRGPIPAGMHVMHKCDVPACVNPDHLVLGTHRQNMEDKVAKGRQARQPKVARLGVSHGMAKLTDQDVIRIRSLRMTNVAIAQEYGMTDSMVSLIRNRRNWTHIPPMASDAPLKKRRKNTT